MNIFVYDAIVDKYKKKLKKFEEKINTLGLQGKIFRTDAVKNLSETIEQEINNGAKTIIVLGDDRTLSIVINILANISQNIAFFIAPFGKNIKISKALGIKSIKEAPFILSARRTETLKLAQANHHFFISNCQISSEGTKNTIDKEISVLSKSKNNYKIINLNDDTLPFNNIKSTPQDSVLELFIKDKKNTSSLIKIKKGAQFINPDNKAVLDNSIEVSTPIDISLSNKTLLFIVGKDRSF